MVIKEWYIYILQMPLKKSKLCHSNPSNFEFVHSLRSKVVNCTIKKPPKFPLVQHYSYIGVLKQNLKLWEVGLFFFFQTNALFISYIYTHTHTQKHANNGRRWFIVYFIYTQHIYTHKHAKQFHRCIAK